ncbi:hemolysin family protein [Kallotenue papyrolyticum]|uniref:hemolysin family protein n=1 Tax=Kallotenue papyrolyticum TaxID=1325125 RepID=UPI0004785982|nr:hemolysin family protein [Kallotenue papyrolyticum]
MDPGPTGELLGLLLCFALTAIASAADAALTALSRHRLNLLQAEGRSRARLIAHLLDDPARLKATTLTLDTLAKCAATALALALLAQPLETQSVLLAPPWWQRLLGVILILLLLLILGEALPKLLATAFPDRTALLLARPIYILGLVLTPITALVNLITTPLARMLGVKRGTPLVTEEELKMLVNVGEEEGLIEKEEREMIEGVLLIGDTLVREVMVPRIDIVSLEASSTIRQAVDVVLKEGHSRIPVYSESIDHIVGVLYVRDLLPLLRDGCLDEPIREHLRPAYFVPETMKVDALLADMRTRKVHLAIVVDEYGGTAGLVTIEDLIEEIVGEIQDEYDVEEPLVQQIAPDTWLVDARVLVHDFNDETGLQLTTGEGDTLGGLVYEQLGRIPKPGDRVVVGEVTITVRSVRGLRPDKLEIVHRPVADEEHSLAQELGDARR